MGGRGPSRGTDPTQTSVRPRTWQSGGGGGRAAPRVGQIGVPAPPPTGPMVRRRNWRDPFFRQSPFRPFRQKIEPQIQVEIFDEMVEMEIV
jgi:hypothetical protein